MGWFERLFRRPEPEPETPPAPRESDAFREAFAATIGAEGGYVNDPRDPGGETQFGISKRSYPDIDIRSLTLDQARAIYLRDFWHANRCDELPARLAVQLFDAAVNHGARPAVSWLQTALGVPATGTVDGATISAARVAPDLSAVLMRFHGQRLAYYTDLATWPTFGRGWARRVARNLRA